MEVLQAVSYLSSKDLAPYPNHYFVNKYKVPTRYYSRYRYTAKIRKDLTERYYKLMKDARVDDWPEFEDIDDGKPEINSFFLIDLKSEKEKLSNIMSAVVEEIQINNDTETNLREINQRGEKLSIVITSNKDVALAALKSATVILVVKDEKARCKFSKTFRDRKNVYVSLRDEVKQILSTHLERCAFTGMKEVCEFLQGEIPAPDSLKSKRFEI